MPDFDVVDSYRGGRADDDFDLPRYQPRTAQRDVRPTNTAYTHMTSPNGPRINPAYTGSMGNTIPPFQQPPAENGGLAGAASQRQLPGRLSQILDADVFGGAGGSLARSTSLGGVSRVRHGGQPPDDVERAFADLPSNTNNSRMAALPHHSQSPPSQSFYNSSITYQNQPSSTGDLSRSAVGDQLPYPSRRATTQQIAQSSTSFLILSSELFMD